MNNPSSRPTAPNLAAAELSLGTRFASGAYGEGVVGAGHPFPVPAKRELVSPYPKVGPAEPEASRDPGVSLIIPAYNEEDRIGRSLDGYIPVLESRPAPYEVIVVADGTDRTAEIARGYELRGVRLLRSDERMGKGGAILAGLRRARYDVVGFTDADGSLSSADFAKLVDIIWSSRLECVIASRWVNGSRWVRKEPLPKRVASRGFNLLVRGLLQLPVHDTQCGAKFFRGQLVDKLLEHVAVTNFTTDVGFLFHARRCGAQITEVPITWDHDPRSHFRLGPMIPVMFLTLLGIRVMNLPLSRFIPESLVRRLASRLGVV